MKHGECQNVLQIDNSAKWEKEQGNSESDKRKMNIQIQTISRKEF